MPPKEPDRDYSAKWGGRESAAEILRRLFYQSIECTSAMLYRTKEQPLYSKHERIPRRSSRAGLSSGKRSLKSTGRRAFADDFSSSEPLINFASSTLDPGASRTKNSALPDLGINRGSLMVRIRLSSSEVAIMLRESDAPPGLRCSSRDRLSFSSSDLEIPRGRRE